MGEFPVAIQADAMAEDAAAEETCETAPAAEETCEVSSHDIAIEEEDDFSAFRSPGGKEKAFAEGVSPKSSGGTTEPAPVPSMQPASDAILSPDANKGTSTKEIDACTESVELNVNTTVEQVAKNGCGGKTCSHSAHHPNMINRDFCSDKIGEVSYGMKKANAVTVDEHTRMELNGETQTMMDYVKKKWKNKCYDTSGDEKWEIDQDLAGTDTYVKIWTYSYLAIKILIFVLPMLLINIVALLPIWAYARRQKTPCDYMERTCGFWLIFILTSFLHLPCMVLLIVGMILDDIVYYIAGFLYTLFHCRWSKCWESHRALDPYRCGPSIVSLGAMADILVCYGGQTMRHGFIGTAYNVTVMYLIMPWLKFFWNVNPWIYDLQERYVQQISTSMKDMAELHAHAGERYVDRGICDGARRIISRGKQFAYVRCNEDYWNFVPHYPYPPPHRRWAMGLQAGGSCNTPAKFTLLVHATHAISDAGGSEGVKSTEQFVLSNSVHSPCYRVMLWYSNPFHFFTGFVEASISNGGDSQPDKFLGGEHPMWLVTGKSPFLSDRDSMTGVGMIDSFFDNWLPIFVHECRRLTHLDNQMIVHNKSLEDALPIAEKEADALYQEVKDQDGLSVMKKKVGRHLYDKDGKLSVLSRQMAQAKGEGVDQSVGIFEKYTELHHEVIQREYEREKTTVDEYVKKQRAEYQKRHLAAHGEGGDEVKRQATSHVHSTTRCQSHAHDSPSH